MEKDTVVKFENFLSRFPIVKPPFTIGEDSHHTFSKKNDPLQQLMINQFILPHEGGIQDEYTEYVPCIKIPDTYQFHAVIYWKAGLMDYQYVLITLTDKGELIDKRIIAGTFSDGQTLTTSVATMDEDWVIAVASGQANTSSSQYDASSSRAYKLELIPDGTIVNYTSE